MKKIVCAILVAIMLLMLAACGGAKKGPDNIIDEDIVEIAEAAPNNVIEMLIREGNALYKNGEDEAAKLVFERVAKLMNARINSPDEFLSSVNLNEKLSDTAKEMLAAYYMIEYVGTEEQPSLPDGYDWGNK